MINKIKEKCNQLKIEYFGITNIEKGSVLVCLFPYYTGKSGGNLSKYAIVPDYHGVCKKYFLEISDILTCETEIYVDVSPYNEVKLAYKAGLGIIGENGLLINEKYGSYVFIGCMLLKNVFLEENSPVDGSCKKCGLCKKNCPLGALSEKNMALCLSGISQKKGDLTTPEADALKNHELIWGCDICSDVCPHNKNAAETPIKEFQSGIKQSLNYDEIENLSQKQFKEKFADRAFTWRGKNVLIRNLKLFSDN